MGTIYVGNIRHIKGSIKKGRFHTETAFFKEKGLGPFPDYASIHSVWKWPGLSMRS
jgi:hypothetical protein